MASNSSQDDIAKIDEEIRALEHKLLSLRSTRNTLIPIGRLPPEVLQGVFNIARGQGTHTIHLSWVSHAWRNIALESKTLWTLINNSNLRWTTIYLERSFPAPLVVNFEATFRKENLFSMVIGQLPRMKALILPIDDWTFDIIPIIRDAFVQHGSLALPRINHMRLTEADITHDVLASLRDARHLSFRWCKNDWTAQLPQFPHLQSLCLTASSTTISVHDLLDRLESMPALRLLILRHILAPISDRDSLMARRPFTNGPKLATLKMPGGDSFESILVFLQKAGCITLETDVSLRMWLVESPLERIREVLVAFDGWATGMGHTQGVTHLGLDTQYSDSVFLEYDPGNGGSRGVVHFQAKVKPGLSHGLAILPILSQSLPLQNLRVLWVRVHGLLSPPLTGQPLFNAFGHLPQLQRFRLQASDASLVDPLLVAMTIQVVNDIQEVPFRALKTLTFQSARGFEGTLLAFLQSRNSSRLRLETLGLSRRQIDDFNEMVWPDSDITEFANNIVNIDEESYPDERDYSFIHRVAEEEEVPFDII